MSEHIPAALRRTVCQRAADCCEYCHFPQNSQEAAFHIDHILPLADGGTTTVDNLALACVTCSLAKAARTVAEDPDTERLARLFHPRRDPWNRHFEWAENWHLIGLTATGRATIRALRMNRPKVIRIRRLLDRLGEGLK